jgi:hypothetical protein
MVQTDIRDAKTETAHILSNQNWQKHQEATNWLSPISFLSQQHDFMMRRQAGTGQWFLDSSEFQGWLQGSYDTLFCPGIPGAGKTMIAAIAIDSLCTSPLSENTGLAYVYCNYKEQNAQTTVNLLCAILKQLVQSRLKFADVIDKLYEQHNTSRTRPSLDEIFDILQIVCSKYTKTYLIIDALDECTNQNNTCQQLLSKIRALQKKVRLQFMATARFMPEIEEEFQSAQILEVHASQGDIQRYVEGHLMELPTVIQNDDELRKTVLTKIAEAVDGM